ncbi:hypothetical protein NPIL_496251 [Nephila pilipes]|uniref:Uncharacterized protein n=1 Tax=Nephila pilipes TaxID=299642 RepID=A0A8X6PR15_NEPPI|nr:hypothetical protein NPIL_496251 [Nephila pilipes]
MRERCRSHCEQSHLLRIIECNCANKTDEDCFSQFISRWRLLSDAHLIRRNSAKGEGEERHQKSKTTQGETLWDLLGGRTTQVAAGSPFSTGTASLAMKFPSQDHVS